MKILITNGTNRVNIFASDDDRSTEVAKLSTRGFPVQVHSTGVHKPRCRPCDPAKNVLYRPYGYGFLIVSVVRMCYLLLMF